MKEIEQVWYAKLKAKGFKDIEDTTDDKRRLKEWDSNFFRNNFNRINYEATTWYYEEAERILIEHEFGNPNEKEVWSLHCRGISEREISEQVRVYAKSRVHEIIAKIAKLIRRGEHGS